MNPGDIRKLLGGYAAGTLTEEERRVLFEAALTDQDLFNELAREQALKELLEEPAARRQLLTALEEKPALIERFRAWLSRPVAWVAAGSLAAATLLVVVVVRRAETPPAPEPVITASLKTASPPEPERSVPRAIAVPATAKPKEPVELPAQTVVAEEKDKGADESKKELRADIALPSPLIRSAQAAGALSVADAIQTNLLATTPADGAGGRAPDRFRFRGSVPYSYRIQRAGADGRFVEAAAGTVIRGDDRVRVVFTSSEQGHLRVTNAAADGSPQLLDVDIAEGATVSLDVPADARELRGTFAWVGTQLQTVGATGAASARPIEVVFAIPIPREPAP
jgi:hypothetical protein